MRRYTSSAPWRLHGVSGTSLLYFVMLWTARYDWGDEERIRKNVVGESPWNAITWKADK
jgi:hypothetical protein